MSNRHLNIFRPFSQNLSKENIEDNLSRAFTLCLQHNNLLLHEFLRDVFNLAGLDQEFINTFSNVTELDSSAIDIQVETSGLNEEFSQVIAITMTGRELALNSFFIHKPAPNKKHYTDVLIRIKDIGIFIEAKRDETDCESQLYKQVAACVPNPTKDNVKPIDYCWPKVMALVNRTHGFLSLTGKQDTLLVDFIDLVRSYEPNWLPVPPLASIQNKITNKYQIVQRFIASLSFLEGKGVEILDYRDRIGLLLRIGWAQEILVRVEEENGEVVVKFCIWPGNTKGQGTQVLKLLKKNPNWKPPTELTIANKQFPVSCDYEIKFCHFNAYVSNLVFSEDKVKEGKKLISEHVHWNHTGKFTKDRWQEVEAFLDSYLIPDYPWRKLSEWEKNFRDSGRNYLTLSVGYEIKLTVPLAYLQTVDSKMENLEPLANLILEIKEKLVNLYGM